MSDGLVCNATTLNEIACVVLQQYRADTGFAVALAVNFAVLFLCCVVFLIARTRIWCVYEPLTRRSSIGKKAFTAPARGLFAWLVSLWQVTDQEIELRRGLDAVVYLKTVKYLFWIMLSLGFFGWIVLFPVHATAVRLLKGGVLTGTARLSMGNVPRGSYAFIADLVSVFWNTVLANVGLYLLYRRYYALRSRSKRLMLPENYTVMVREVQERMSEDDIARLFDNIFMPGSVHSVTRAYHSRKLRQLLEEREEVGLELEAALAYPVYHDNERAVYYRVPLIDRFLVLVGAVPRRDAIDYLRDEFDSLSRQVAELQASTSGDALPVFFVTFNRRHHAQLAGQVVVNHFRFRHPLQQSFITAPAPAPETVVWHVLHVGHLPRWLMSALVNAATFALIFFWMIPIGFASSLANLDTLGNTLPFLQSPINALPQALKSFLIGFLPGLVIIIFFAILVKLIITPLARLEGQWSHAVVVRSIFNKYYLFNIVNIFLGSIFASGALAVFPQIVNNPTIIVSLLAGSLPSQVTYFINYTMIASLSTFGMHLVRPGPLIMYLLRRWTARTKRKQRALQGPFVFNYHVEYARHLLIFAITVAFSTLNPLILPFGCIYFGICYLVHRYLLVYVCLPQERTEGAIFPAVFARLSWSLVVYQVLLGGVLAGSGFAPSYSLFILAILQILFMLNTDRQFHGGAKHGALEAPDGDLDFKEDLEISRLSMEAPLLRAVVGGMADSTTAATGLRGRDDRSDETPLFPAAVPSPKCYQDTCMRPPLFQLDEDQSDAAETSTEVNPLFWEPEWEPSGPYVVSTEQQRTSGSSSSASRRHNNVRAGYHRLDDESDL